MTMTGFPVLRATVFMLSALAFVSQTQPAAAQTIAITGGKVYPVSGPPIENGTVLITNGKIVRVGVNIPIPANARRVDASGKWVTPGLINSSTQLGLVEIGQVADTRDMQARGRASIPAPVAPRRRL